jgi:TPR repeat protein
MVNEGKEKLHGRRSGRMKIITILCRGKLCGLLLLIFVFLPNLVVASDYATGREAAIAGNYEEAISIWEKLVPKGNVLAMYSLAQIYQNGLGVLKDYEKARTFFHLAAVLEYPDAQYALGAHYFSLVDGNFSVNFGPKSILRMNIIKGYTWLSIAAKNGHTKAPELLNQIEGAGLPAHLVIEAQRWAKNCEDRLVSC